MLCVLVDLAALDGVAPAEQERILLHELAEYRPELLDRPRLVVGTKADAVPTADAPPGGSIPGVGRRRPSRDLGGHRRQGVRRSSGRWRRWSTRPGDRHPSARAWSAAARCPRVRWSSASATSEFRLVGREVERVVALNDVTHARGARLHRLPARAARRATRCSPTPAPARATSCGSASSASTTSRTVSVRVGRRRSARRRSPTTRRDRRRGVAKLVRRGGGGCARAGHEVIVVSSGAVAAGVAALGLPSRPSRHGARCRRSPPPGRAA